MQERVAVVESTLHHGARHSFSIFRYNVPNVTERSEMKTSRLTDGVGVFLCFRMHTVSMTVNHGK